MISNKKRKLDGPIHGDKSISAVAARKRLQAVDITSKSLVQTEISVSPQRNEHFNGDLVSSLRVATSKGRERHDFPDFGEDTKANDGNIHTPHYLENSETNDVITTSREDVGTQLRLTTLSFNENNIKRHENGVTIASLGPDERLVVLGEFGISVVKGTITILGATLSASSTVYPVFSLLSHSLPVIQFMPSKSNRAEIQLHHRPSGLRLLQHLSPLFDRIWPGGTRVREPEQGHPDFQPPYQNSEPNSYEILYSNDDVPRKKYLNLISCPPEWNEILASVVSGAWEHGSLAVVMICGPKSSGKSTFAKLLINQLLTSSMASSEQATTVSINLRNPGVAFLDIDPGQPEYAPPGQISLVHVTRPNFGPPYSHPAPNAGMECIRAHSIASNSPANDTALYLECLDDLLSNYRTLKSRKKCPLVINTPGWVLGTGLELLTELVRKARPTVVIYMSQQGPNDVVQTLKHVAGPIPLMTLPSQSTEPTARTTVHLRSMQVMSYLHIRPEREGKESWNPNPLVSIPPLMLKYSGNNAGIFGIMCQGEQPPAEMVMDRINGSLVAVVVMDDNTVDPERDVNLQGIRTRDRKMRHKQAYESSLITDDNVKEEVILRTPELIPYFNPKLSISLDPRYSHTVGLALIRGVDVKKRRFHLLTPIPLSIFENIRSLGNSIVLVSGDLDTPGWAYMEQFCQRTGTEKRRKYQGDQPSDQNARDGGITNSLDIQDNIEADFECAPWVNRVRADQGRGVGAKAWRVRRDLGKNSTG